MTKIKTALITGASSGIGWATAQSLAAKGYRLILCGRRAERLNTLASQLEVPTYSLLFDVRDRQAVFEAIDSLPLEWKDINVLINNA